MNWNRVSAVTSPRVRKASIEKVPVSGVTFYTLRIRKPRRLQEQILTFSKGGCSTGPAPDLYCYLNSTWLKSCALQSSFDIREIVTQAGAPAAMRNRLRMLRGKVERELAFLSHFHVFK